MVLIVKLNHFACCLKDDNDTEREPECDGTFIFIHPHINMCGQYFLTYSYMCVVTMRVKAYSHSLETPAN